MKFSKIGVYILSDLNFKRYFIGHSSDVNNAYRSHCLKLKSSPRETKHFKKCIMIAKIEGFPSLERAKSYKWFASTDMRLPLRKNCLRIGKTRKEKLENFFAPLSYYKFSDLKNKLIVQVFDPCQLWSKDVKDFYNVKVRDIDEPFYPTHVNKKRRFVTYELTWTSC
jgi:hypothetical protein